MRVHNYKQAWAQVEDHLKTTDFANIEDLFERLCEWDDKKVATRLGSVLIERLIKNAEFDRANRVFTECYAMLGGRVQLPSGSAALILMERAKDATLRKRLYETLQNFDEDFPNHPNTPNVFLMIAEMALKTYKDNGTGALYLQKASDYDESVQEQTLYKQLTRLTSQG